MPTPRRGRGASRGHSRFSDARVQNDTDDYYGEMNANLSERVGRSTTRHFRGSALKPSAPRAKVNQDVGRYFRKKLIDTGAPNWTLRPEIPSIEEILPYNTFEHVAPPSGFDGGWNQAQDHQLTPSVSDRVLFDEFQEPNTDPDTSGWDNSGQQTNEWEIAPASNTAWENAQADSSAWETAPTNNDPWGASSPANDPWGEDNAASGNNEAPNASYAQTKSDFGTHFSTAKEKPETTAPEPWVEQDVAPDLGQNDDFDESFENVYNKINGPWDSTRQYLRNHYLLLREDALRPLRESLQMVRVNLDLQEELSRRQLGLYDQVHVCGITFSPRGLGIRVNFSLGRIGKKIRWEQSQRLKTGSLVVLMTPDKSICKVATVAARTQENLAKNPPEIDLFMARAEDLDIDCSQEWLMIEDRTSYFESSRYTMTALQRMSQEKFPLQEHLVHVQQTVDPPQYIATQPVRDMHDVFDDTPTPIDLLGEWPARETELDVSQLSALRTILTKRLALVQGPPGTGKTHVSVQALRVLLRNMSPGDPPVVVTCQTNHALDQLLRHINEYEPNFVRLGGRTQDREVVGPRTIYNLKESMEPRRWTGSVEFEKIISEMERLIAPLVKTAAEVKDVLDLGLLRDLDVISEAQHQSLIKATETWVSHDPNPVMNDPVTLWVGSRNLVRVEIRKLPFLGGFEDDESDLDPEELQEKDAENAIKDEDDEIERLKGTYYMLGDTWTGKGPDHRQAIERSKELLKRNDNLYNIKMAERGAVYRHLQRETKRKITERLRQLFPKYKASVESRSVHLYESNEIIARQQKIVGLTTTGLSKYRTLIAALQPKVILIEEAAETMEAPVIAACVESLEHLILVGDHKQLRPPCQVRDLEFAPYFMNISLFERLVDNGVEFSMLQRQRRMKPEIRRLIVPIYGDTIKDHSTVRDRLPVPGMGGLTTWFYTHTVPEERDLNVSAFNSHELEMIFGLVQYLVFNKMRPEQITVLAFYRAQVRMLLRKINKFPATVGVKVVTVDSYQGEENEVVILSLVRSNIDGTIGFTSVENRICVALSRAKRGFYIFGNGELMASESKLWSQVLTNLYNGAVGKEPKNKLTNPAVLNPFLPRRRIGFTIPLWCPRHRRMTYIRHAADWERNVGGCDLRCGGTLQCGHRCVELCHPWAHSEYRDCKQPCSHVLPCGHPCSLPCCEPMHICLPCEKQPKQSNTSTSTPKSSAASTADRSISDTNRPPKPSIARSNGSAQSPTSPLRMGRLIEGDFDGLNVGGDGYSYDMHGRPVLQGQHHEPPPARPTDRHAQAVAAAQHQAEKDRDMAVLLFGEDAAVADPLQPAARPARRDPEPLPFEEEVYHPKRFVNRAKNNAAAAPVAPAPPSPTGSPDEGGPRTRPDAAALDGMQDGPDAGHTSYTTTTEEEPSLLD